MNNIPHIIHYCWFGREQKNDLIRKCMKSWSTYCPNYTLMEWNEDNSDFCKCKYAMQAYESKKWAFVSDYVRLVALYKHGGIYLDTDVELLQSMDELVDKYEAFVGYAENLFIGTATIACAPNNQWIKMLIDEYRKKVFVDDVGNLDVTPNNIIITDLTVKNGGFKIGDNNIKVGNVSVLPTEFFSPYKRHLIGGKAYKRDNYVLSCETICIHHTDLSWQTSKDFSLIQRINRQLIRCILPSKFYWKLKKIITMKKMKW